MIWCRRLQKARPKEHQPKQDEKLVASAAGTACGLPRRCPTRARVEQARWGQGPGPTQANLRRADGG